MSAALYKIHDGYTFLGKKIEESTSRYLHRTVSTALQQVYWGLPMTLALTLVPVASPMTLVAAAAAHLAIYLFEMKGALEKETVDSLYLGIRNFCIIEAIKAPILGYMFWPIFLVSAVDSAMRADKSHLDLWRNE